MNVINQIDILELISLKQEGGYWDFKREWYANNSDLLHDIICMANNLENRDGYIIIGVDEEKDFAMCGVDNDPNRKNTQNIVDFLRDKHFAGDIRPTVSVETITYDDVKIDVIVIHSERNTPYYLTEQYQGVFANNIYTRIQDTNTPKNKNADVYHIEKLWRKHFGLDATALERVIIYLKDTDGWTYCNDGSSKKYYKFAPEFTIEHTSTDRDGYEFYLFGQYDSRPHWYDINVYCHQTMLDSIGGVGLDGGRYLAASPLTDGISFSEYMNRDISYKYFIEDSIEYIVNEFLYDFTNHEATCARRKYFDLILLFESDYEKEKFDDYVVENFKTLKGAASEYKLPHFPNIEGYNMNAFKDDYHNALILKQMLDSFRIKEKGGNNS